MSRSVCIELRRLSTRHRPRFACADLHPFRLEVVPSAAPIGERLWELVRVAEKSSIKSMQGGGDGEI